VSSIDVSVPDIGDFKDVPVIEILVKPGDAVKKNDSLIVLESDKASMEIPSPADGVVQAITAKVGDKVTQGAPILTLSVITSERSEQKAEAIPRQARDDEEAPRQARDDEGKGAPAEAVIPSEASAGDAHGGASVDGAHDGRESTEAPEARSRGTATSERIVEITVPDIGDFKDVPVIEVLIKPGDVIAKEASVATLESEKASIEIPATAAGTVRDVRVKVGDKVSKGTVLATVATQSAEAQSVIPSDAHGGASVDGAQDGRESTDAPDSVIPSDAPQARSRGTHVSERSEQEVEAIPRQARDDEGATRQARDDGAAQARSDASVHASPSVRRFSRELGVDLRGVRGSGPNGRVTHEDVQGFVKSALRGGTSLPGLPPWPSVDFAKFGEIERTPLSRIKKLSGPNLHRNWIQIPHITNYDEADITDLEAFRNDVNAEQAKSGGAKLTMLAFLVKACIAALQRFPDFNASLDGDALVHKKYYNIGFAADTPNGLIVPVIKGADRLGLLDIAKASAELAAKARDGKLGVGDMQGGTFTISSIGGIGGTAFTQIVNAPEVAILGATRSSTKPVWDGEQFGPRLMLPISVSYDHRVIDGASAARFLVYLAGLLRDFRRVAL
jgi:pyruvate dehydrogenase E2 component (dihydrolipoamide acetyltransferase)